MEDASGREGFIADVAVRIYKIEEELQKTAARLDRLDQAISSMNERIEELSERLGNNLGAAQRVSAWVSDAERRLGQPLHQAINSIDQDVVRLRKSGDGKVAKFTDEISRINGQIAKLQTAVDAKSGSWWAFWVALVAMAFSFANYSR